MNIYITVVLRKINVRNFYFFANITNLGIDSDDYWPILIDR